VPVAALASPRYAVGVGQRHQQPQQTVPLSFDIHPRWQLCSRRRQFVGAFVTVVRPGIEDLAMMSGSRFSDRQT
jgi:hypothetical protein